MTEGLAGPRAAPSLQLETALPAAGDEDAAVAAARRELRPPTEDGEAPLLPLLALGDVELPAPTPLEEMLSCDLDLAARAASGELDGSLLLRFSPSHPWVQRLARGGSGGGGTKGVPLVRAAAAPAVAAEGPAPLQLAGGQHGGASAPAGERRVVGCPYMAGQLLRLGGRAHRALQPPTDTTPCSPFPTHPPDAALAPAKPNVPAERGGGECAGEEDKENTFSWVLIPELELPRTHPEEVGGGGVLQHQWHACLHRCSMAGPAQLQQAGSAPLPAPPTLLARPPARRGLRRSGCGRMFCA